MSDRNQYYADAFINVLLAEGKGNDVSDELFRFAKVVEANDELRDALAEPTLPLERRLQIVDDLLANKANAATVGLVQLLVTTGRITQMPEIVDRLLESSASRSDRALAQVRSAVPLTDDQKARLAESLKAITGKEVDLLIEVDPTVIGGLVTQIGDTVIDGSIRQRLTQLRESI
jgi:F-type H+-transporting ATPase subunit delta